VSDSQNRLKTIANEKDLWGALKAILISDDATRVPKVSFEKYDWAAINIIYSGEKYKGTLTTSSMQGIIEFQNCVFRSAALILTDSPDVRKLSSVYKELFELTFSVKDGSANAEASTKDILSALVRIVNTMESKHKLVALPVFGGLFLTGVGMHYYVSTMSTKFSHEEKMAKEANTAALIDGQSSTTKTAMTILEKNVELLRESLNKSPQAAVVMDQSQRAFDQIVRNSRNVEGICVQGVIINRQQIEEIKESPRRTSVSISFNEEFELQNVDLTSPDGYVVRVKSRTTGLKFYAIVYDGPSSEKIRKTIKNAEWRDKIVKLHITGRRLGEEIFDARVISARAIRAQKMEQARGKTIYSGAV
jgi:hypothetical protein